MDRRRFRLAFAAVVGAALVWRLLYVLVFKTDDIVVGDQIYYSGQGVTIANGNWFEAPFVPGTYAADHAPLTALAVAPGSWSDADPFVAQRLLMALYGTAVVAGVGLLTRWLFDRRTALVATVIAAVYANFWMNDGLIMAETLAVLGVVAVLFFAYRYDLERTWPQVAFAGVAVGFAGLARAELLLLGLLVVAPVVVFRSSVTWRMRVAHLAIAGLAAVAIIAPWVIRNQVRFDESVTMSTQDGLTLLGTNCPPAFFGPGVGFWHLSCALDVEVPAAADQSVVSGIYRDLAFDYLGDNVGELPRVVAARLGRGLSFWKTDAMTSLNQGEGRERLASTIGLWQYWLLLPLAAYGLWKWPSTQSRWPLVGAMAMSVLTIMALYGIPRFRIASEVAIVVAASAGLAHVGSRRSRNESSDTESPALAPTGLVP